MGCRKEGWRPYGCRSWGLVVRFNGMGWGLMTHLDGKGKRSCVLSLVHWCGVMWWGRGNRGVRFNCRGVASISVG